LAGGSGEGDFVFKFQHFFSLFLLHVLTPLGEGVPNSFEQT
jgi:hypothetical protein